jgi:hypothetical protein
MAGYRGPDATRIRAQTTNILQYAGQTALWQHFVSASGGTPAAGLTNTLYFRQTVITALFSNLQQPEDATPAGMIAASRFSVITQERLERDDRLVWNGVDLRIDSDPVTSRITNLWVSEAVRADP